MIMYSFAAVLSHVYFREIDVMNERFYFFLSVSEIVVVLVAQVLDFVLL